jgi:hypothetical protein
MAEQSTGSNGATPTLVIAESPGNRHLSAEQAAE